MKTKEAALRNPSNAGKQTKTERCYMLLVSNLAGVTENEILRACNLSSGRNYPNQLEGETGITLERIQEPNPDGIGAHYRYRITSPKDALKSIEQINKRRVRRKAGPLSADAVAALVGSFDSIEKVANG